MDIYASIKDYETIYDCVVAENKQNRTLTLLELASSLLREEARKRGYDLDKMIENNPDKGNVAKLLVLSAVHRVFEKDEINGAVSQYSESALGYQASATYVNPGDDLYFLNNELRRLGILKQRFGSISLL